MKRIHLPLVSEMPASMLWSFLLYFAWVLVPIIPATVIYKLFPDSKFTAEGPLQNLTLSTGGAAAMYLVTLLIGSVLAYHIDARIQQSFVRPTWEWIAQVKFLDLNDKEIPPDEILSSTLKVYVKPDAVTPTLPNVYIRVPLRGENEWPQSILFDVPGFFPVRKDPRDEIERNRVRPNYGDQQVNLGEIILRQHPQAPNAPSANYPLPVEGGPPAVESPRR